MEQTNPTKFLHILVIRFNEEQQKTKQTPTGILILPGNIFT